MSQTPTNACLTGQSQNYPSQVYDAPNTQHTDHGHVNGQNSTKSIDTLRDGTSSFGGVGAAVQHSSMTSTQSHQVSETWHANSGSASQSKWSSFWKSTTGRFLLGLSGAATFRACYDRARGHIGDRAGAMLVRYDRNASLVCNTAADQYVDAKAAGRWELGGVAASGLMGFVPNIVCALVGSVAGGVARLFNGGTISKQEMLREITSNGSLENYLAMAQDGLAGDLIAAGGVKTVKQGLQWATRSLSDGCSEKLQDDVRAFRAVRRHMFRDPLDSRRLELSLALRLLVDLQDQREKQSANDNGDSFKEDCAYILEEFPEFEGANDQVYAPLKAALEKHSRSGPDTGLQDFADYPGKLSNELLDIATPLYELHSVQL